MPFLTASFDIPCATPNDVGRAIAYEHSLAHIVSVAAIGPGSYKPLLVPDACPDTKFRRSISANLVYASAAAVAENRNGISDCKAYHVLTLLTLKCSTLLPCPFQDEKRE
jgi:hypothetical protein